MTRNLNFIAITLLLLFGLNLTGIAQSKKDETIKITTSAVCGSCKDRIEKGISKETGVKKASLDIESKVLTVTYAPDKTDPDKIRKAVSLIGYDADNVKADTKAYDKLPACCKVQPAK